MYNLWLHPLKTFPGPKICAISRLPYLWHKLQGTYHREVLSLFETYGPVVRIAPDELAFSQSDAWKDIYGLLPGRRQNPKDLNVWPPKQQGWDKALPVAADVNHSRLKRALAPSFTLAAVQRHEATIIKHVDLLIGQLQCSDENDELKSECKPRNISEWFDFLTFDITGELVFSVYLQCLSNAKAHPWIQTIMDSLPLGVTVTHLNRFGMVSMLLALVPQSVLAHFNKPSQYARAIVRRRLEMGRTSMLPAKDIFADLLASERHGIQLDTSSLEANAIFLILAGGETVASLLSAAVWLLCTNGGAYEKLQEEIRVKFRSTDSITNDTLSSMTYLTAVINETLRIFPPTPEGIPRIVSSKGGQTIAGHWVPYGTSCAVHHWAASHFQRNFYRPHDFLPERWLGRATEFAGDDYDVSQPFSWGPRSCIGSK